MLFIIEYLIETTDCDKLTKCQMPLLQTNSIDETKLCIIIYGRDLAYSDFQFSYCSK